jgi:tetraacyldisaccharide 4'-kinase
MDEAALHELLSGRRNGAGARVLRGALEVASWGYSSVMSLRNLAYARQWLPVHHATVPVISLGNITTGGTGKTPLAAWLANWLVSHGHQPGLLSRGYHSLTSEESEPGAALGHSDPGNDEKRVLDRLCPGVPHIQQRDRVSSSQRIVREFGCDVILLDDGFQHRRLHRDLDLVLIDALQPWGYGRVLPRGLLRESISGLRRADLILITRADQCTVEQRQALLKELCRVRGTDERIEVAFTPTRLVDLNWQAHPLNTVLRKKTFAFCGIGNPAGFRQTVSSLGVIGEQTQAFPDHHHYDDNDLKRLANTALDLSAEIVLTHTERSCQDFDRGVAWATTFCSRDRR